MSSHSRLTFHGVAPAVFAQLRKRAAQNGIIIRHSCGDAVKHGVRISWLYDIGNQSLVVECTRTAFWIDVSHVTQRLTAEIEATLGIRQIA